MEMEIIEGTLDMLFFLFSCQQFDESGCFFSLKPSLTQGKSSPKISARWGSPFRRSQGTNRQTYSLTDWSFYYRNFDGKEHCALLELELRTFFQQNPKNIYSLAESELPILSTDNQEIINVARLSTSIVRCGYLAQKLAANTLFCF